VKMNGNGYAWGKNDQGQAAYTPLVNSPFVGRIECAQSLSTENFDAVKFQFYPNPTSGMLFCNVTVKQATIYTMQGQSIGVAFDSNRTDVSSLAAGIYLIRGTDSNGNAFSEKFIKE